MLKLRTIGAALLTFLFLASSTVPAAAASTLYYTTQQQLSSYQKLNQRLISQGLQPYNLAPKPGTQPTSPAPAPAPRPKPAPKPKPTPKPAPAPQPTPSPAPQASTNDALLTAPLTAQEQQMIDLVNQERTKAGVKTLAADMRLVKAARMKSLDMIKNNYFGHQSPVYGSPFDLLKAQGITYKAAGENIAGNASVAKAHTSLMNSSGHRANILNPDYTKIGIGIISGGPYGLMISQEFIG